MTQLEAYRPPLTDSAPGRMTGIRWWIVALLFFATTINYIDRTVFAILAPMLRKEFHWSALEYARMVMAFQLTYAVGYIFAGRLLDMIGVRRGFLLVVGVWSLAAMAHGLVRYVPAEMVLALGFGITLSVPVLAFGAAPAAALGLAEGGSFPSSIKCVCEWFPREERAFATGLFNAGSNLGAIACPLLVPWMVRHWGWPAAFYATGATGVFWVLAWWFWYHAPEQHPQISAAELAYIRKDPPEHAGKIPWLQLLWCRPTWTFIVGMVVSAPVWWFYIYWGPTFLESKFHLDLDASRWPLVLIFIGSSVGGIGGGWISSALIRRGWSVNLARKLALLTCALVVLPVVAAPMLPATCPWIAVGLIALAAAGHSGYAANLFTLVSDTMPRHAVGSVVGIGGMASSLAAMLFAEVTGQVLKSGAGYQTMFTIGSLSYLCGLAIMHLLTPRLNPAKWSSPQPE